jgi:exonuclease III
LFAVAAINYREWKNSVTGLNDKKSQAEDLIRLTNIWRRYTDRDQDFVSLGDMNICSKQMDNENYAHSDLADILQEFLLSENCSQLINQYTRIK